MRVRGGTSPGEPTYWKETEELKFLLLKGSVVTRLLYIHVYIISCSADGTIHAVHIPGNATLYIHTAMGLVIKY